MRRYCIRGARIGIVLVLILGLCACSNRKQSESEKEKSIRIGVTIYRGDDAFITSLYSYMEDAVKEKEKEIGRKIVLTMADAKKNQSSQTDQVDDFIQKEYDAICVNLVDRTVASVIVNKAKEAEVPLVFFNREPVQADLDLWDKVYYVGSDAKEAGELEGQVVVEAYQKNPELFDKNGDGKIQYVLLEGDQGHQDSMIRTEYTIKTITDAGIPMERLDIITANWMRNMAYATMLEWIGRFGDEMELVVSNNDDMAIGAIEAINENREVFTKKPQVVGTDGIKEGLEMVQKSEMLGTVKNDAKGQAEAVLDIACAEALNQKVKEIRPGIKGRDERISQHMVNQDNVNEYIGE
ncbi:methyl-galactoside transport system substrate-binding protein [Aequitasia blattaphilus]|uniref:D-galactose/methyl-galactoside binding periplasmic protein MglB n=1 Tax=Aequitasia blattaphilus TaxID=2949332 RepID=A0ABT1E861_9FIRM|nr:galactose ABC transporter substrate-binding protein [Aequitasia blattaphilus]MCP1102008.1 galactose ABC transporter substrate-binding protein [Aequitasia blattaphilus]MCR8614648.1 galactose ABC transporter substrate-binding protein [Aequitasia blattaphilus]